MYIRTNRGIVPGNGVLGKMVCSRNFWIFQRRYIQIVHNNARILSKGLQKKPVNFDKVASLKFDPSDDVTDFTSFGILPFFQEKLNKLLLPENTSETSAPDYNVPPTPDQRTLLSVLNSEHSLIHRGSLQTGKSLALLIYALNHTLSKVPTFGSLKNTKSPESVDSIILAPTDLLIGKYEFYTRELTKDIPEMCCPDKLLVDRDNNDSSVTRKPLTVKFIYSDRTTKTLSSSNSSECSSRTPQMLVTTPSRLYEIMNEEKTIGNITKENLNEVRFFAIDETDFLLNNTNISNGNNSNLVKSGKKSKYVNKIEKIIRQLQTSQVENYSSNLYRRLRTTENLHRNVNPETFEGNKFDHTKFVFEDNTLSTSSVSITIEQLLNGSSPNSTPDESLLKKLIKVKRKVLYKPIQYCFIFHPRHSYQQILLQLSNKKILDESILKGLQKKYNTKSDDKLQQEYNKFLLEKATRNDQKQEDSQVNFIEKLIRFDDSKRFYRKQERKIVSVGSFNIDNSTLHASNEFSHRPNNKVQTYFVEARNKGKNSKQVVLRDVEVAKNFPEKKNIIAVLEKDVENSGYNIKNLMKNFLKYRSLSISTLSKKGKLDGLNFCTEIVRETILKFRTEYPLDTNPILIIVPPFIEAEILSNDLNKKSSSHDKFTHLNSNKFSTINVHANHDFDYLALQNYFLKQSPKEYDVRTNIIAHPYQLLGQTINGLTNLIVIGMESLLPQLAFGSKYLNLNDMAGIEDPISDLSSFYLSKMSTFSDSKARNLLFVLNSCNRDHSKDFHARVSNDFLRLSQIILYNDLQERIKLSKICEEQPAFTELVYGIDKLFHQRIRNDINKHVYK